MVHRLAEVSYDWVALDACHPRLVLLDGSGEVW